MIEKELLLNELQKQIKETDNEQVKLALAGIVGDILSGRFNIRLWD